MDAMDRNMALATIMWCDQIEQALIDEDQQTIDAVTLKLLRHIAGASSTDIRVMIECGRARAHEVLRGEDRAADE